MYESSYDVKPVTGPQVCLILGLAAILAGSVVGLAAMNKDVGSIFTAVAAVLITVGVSFGWAKANQLSRDVTHVKETTNGRMTEQIEANRELNKANEELNRQLQQAMLRLPPPPEETTRDLS